MRKFAAALAAATIAGALVLAASPAAFAEETDEPGVIAVTPIGVELVDDCGTMNDGFFFPEAEEGVIKYDIQGGFGAGYIVTAVLAEGYVLAEGAPGAWEFPALTDAACEEAGAPTDPSQPATPAESAGPAQSSTLAETGFEGDTAGAIAAAAVLLGGALLGGVLFARRRAAE